MKSHKTISVDSDLFFKWKEKSNSLPFSTWVGLMMDSFVNGSDSIISRERGKLNVIKESFSNGNPVNISTNNIIEEKKVFEGQIRDKREELNGHVREWLKLQVKVLNEKNPKDRDAFDEYTRQLQEKFGISRAELVALANKGRGVEVEV